ncbi:thiamine pyrophosphate-dependent dehydrogenase E1 component subunit alpha [Halorubrum laminariae]|uniref:Thiamine pyrophosphate-dependent dehydrogenase E1 component subunit alpha n=1 Tax=Halorubrum laminariae TaxID=1433523 RepID=A0ABD6C4U8_9EURY|nr:thiamine pyrophosphate-dependent dehydrogenase E1 component subunit alpha [Halorubrum laminariae]
MDEYGGDPLADEDVVRVLDANGRPLSDATVPDLSDDRFRAIYRDLVVTRRFDERAVSLQRQGRIGTYAPCAGQEASAVGSTHALADRDLISYQYREHGAIVVRDLLTEYLPYWMGHEVGTEAIAAGNVFPLNIGIGAHIPHAVGAAWAFDYRDEDRVAACHFGGGATSEGDFHEAMNFAGVFDTPTLFCCHANGWAISIPESGQTASETFAQKADAYGFDGIRVDGMDPLASYAVTREAAKRARSGGDGSGGDESDGSGSGEDGAGGDGSGGSDGDTPPRPALIEFVEYRFGAHTTADDPTVYRDPDEVDRWRALDPLDRMETFLRETGRIDDEGVAAIREEADEVVADAIDAAESVEADPADMFDNAYDELPPELRRQRDELLDAVDEHGADAFSRE